MSSKKRTSKMAAELDEQFIELEHGSGLSWEGQTLEISNLEHWAAMEEQEALDLEKEGLPPSHLWRHLFHCLCRQLQQQMGGRVTSYMM